MDLDVLFRHAFGKAGDRAFENEKFDTYESQACNPEGCNGVF